jgi:hypothetical protein
VELGTTTGVELGTTTGLELAAAGVELTMAEEDMAEDGTTLEETTEEEATRDKMMLEEAIGEGDGFALQSPNPGWQPVPQ